MFFNASPKRNDVDHSTVEQLACLMEDVDPSAVVFDGGVFSFNKDWFPHVDKNTLENINKHYCFLKAKLGLRRKIWGWSNTMVEHAYIRQLLIEHNYHDKFLNPMSEVGNEPQINPTPCMVSNQILPLIGRSRVDIGAMVNQIGAMMMEETKTDTPTPKPIALPADNSKDKPTKQTKKKRWADPWVGLEGSEDTFNTFYNKARIRFKGSGMIIGELECKVYSMITLNPALSYADIANRLGKHSQSVERAYKSAVSKFDKLQSAQTKDDTNQRSRG